MQQLYLQLPKGRSNQLNDKTNNAKMTKNEQNLSKH